MSVQVFRVGDNGRLLATREALAPLQPQEVRVRTLAVSLNFRDLGFIRGRGERSAGVGRVPFTDAVGVVVETGIAVQRFKPGDRVNTTVLPNWLDGPLTAAGFDGSPGSRARDGVMADELQRAEHELVLAPKNLSHVQAATLPVAALTAWHAVVELGAVQAGQTVLIQSTGGVATFAIQFAVALGARVIVTSRSSAKLAKARALGAWQGIDTTVTPEWDQEVLALTEGRGVELVLDMGLDDSLRRSARAAAFEGTVAIVGVVECITTAMDIFPVMNKNLRVRGVETGSRAMFERMNRFIEAHGIEPVVDSVHAVDHTEAALERLAQSPMGKVVVAWEPQASADGSALTSCGSPHSHT